MFWHLNLRCALLRIFANIPSVMKGELHCIKNIATLLRISNILDNNSTITISQNTLVMMPKSY